MRRSQMLLAVAVLIAAAVVAWFVVPRQTAPNDQQVSIGIATWPGFAPVFVASERGYFGGVEVEVDIVDDFSARQAAYTSGRHDFTIYTIDSLAFDAGHGVDGQIVLVLDESRGADGLVVRSGIGTVQDLRGRRVAYTRGSPAHFFLVDTLRDAGMTVADITTVEVDDPTRAAEAFLAGSVDAAVTWEPYLSQVRESGKGTVLADTRTRPGRVVDVLVASRDVVRNRPELVEAVVRGWRRALDEVHEPRPDTMAIMAQGLGMPEQDFTGGAAGVAFADHGMNRTWLEAPAGQPSRGVTLFQTAGQIWRTEQLSQTPEDAARYFEPRFALSD